VFTARMFSAEQKCLCGAINLKMAEQHWMMIHRNTKEDQGSCILMNADDAVWISPTKNNNQQQQILQNSQKIVWSH
jgi:hypothetical protein